MNSISNPVSKLGAKPGKYLTVQLHGEYYGIPILSVREIIRVPRITPVPQMPGWVSGVINLRGRIIAVTDLRAKFGLPSSFADHTCIVVVHVPMGSGRIVEIGLVVDSVEEVSNVAEADIEPPPEFGIAVNTEYLLGIAKAKSRVSMLLDINRVVTGEALTQIAALSP
jgi:purine-binding chemotaxis protein CheW